jgi:hypothetical protein
MKPDKESRQCYQDRCKTCLSKPQVVTVTRLKKGLKELDPGVLKPIPERYEAAYGEGSWNYYLDDYAKAREKME